METRCVFFEVGTEYMKFVVLTVISKWIIENTAAWVTILKILKYYLDEFRVQG
jgi:hypothetical protein